MEQVMMKTHQRDRKTSACETHTSLRCTDQETRCTVSNAAAESMKMVESPITKRSSKTFQSADFVLRNWTEIFQSDIRVRYLFPSGPGDGGKQLSPVS